MQTFGTVGPHVQISVAAIFKASIHHSLASGRAAFWIACRASSSRPCLSLLHIEEIKPASS
jgi:hypothetical protein